MYSLAPRCSDAWSPRSVPACCSLAPSSAAKLGEAMAAANTAPATRTINFFTMRGPLVMRRHPFRHRPGPVPPGPQRHGDEERVVEEGQQAPDDGLDRVGARTGADLHQPQERD